MAGFAFKIPVNEEELLNGDCGGNVVGQILSVAEVCKSLKVAQESFRDVGCSFIIDAFGTYYSVVHLHQELPRVVVYTAFEDMRKSIATLPNVLNLHLEQAGDEDVPAEVQQEVRNIINMTIYLYIMLFACLEKSTGGSFLEAEAKKAKQKKKRDGMDADANLVVNWIPATKVLISLLQLELQKFWDAAGVEDALVNKILELVFTMLEEARIKQEKDTQGAIWTLLGLLLIYYNADNILLIRLGRFVKDHDHAVQLLAEGLTHIVNVFGARAFVEKFTRELTEWQIQETNVESVATKNCTRMVAEMAVQMPLLMETQLDYIGQFLRADNYHLRLMVLSVQVAIMQEGMQRFGTMEPGDVERWRQLRDNILDGMLILTKDKSSYVRARIFGFVDSLVRTGQIPSQFITTFLQKSVMHLRDVSCPVRKAATSCVSSILKYNLLGPKLSFAKISKDYKDRQAELMQLKWQIFNVDPEEQKRLELEWMTHVPGLKAELMRLMEEHNDEAANGDGGEENEQEESENGQEEGEQSHVDGDAPQQEEGDAAESAEAPPAADNESIPEQIRQAIRTKDYRKAVALCKQVAASAEPLQAMRERMSEVSNTIFYVMYLRVVFSNMNVAQPQPDQIEALSKLEASVDYLKDAVEFVQMLNMAMRSMCELLNSVNVSDMHEAVDFIITAKSFSLDEATQGINALLKVMLRIEEDRRKIAGQALRSVFLTTEAKQLADHTMQVVENLITQYQSVSSSCRDALERLIITWAADGTLSNDIIDMLWSYFLMRVPTTEKNARAVLGLLRMAAKGRHTIITRNYHVVSSVCFGERGVGDPLLVVEGLDMLYMLVHTPFSATSDEPAFRLPPSDAVWRDLLLLMQSYRDTHIPCVHNVIASCVRLIFGVHTQPLKFIDTFIEYCAPQQGPSFQEPGGGPRVYRMRNANLIAYNTLIGEIAEATLRYLDVNVYVELKRRQNQRELKKQVKGKKKKAPTSGNESLMSAQKSGNESSIINASSAARRKRNNTLNSTLQSMADDTNTEMVGAEAMDEDADFIAHVLEHILDENTTLGRMFKRVLWACRSPTSVNNELVQVSAAGALARGMLVSTIFCAKHVQLLFTMLLKSKFVQVKITILVHMVDLLDRCPNVIEPYTTMLYSLLDDKHPQIRRLGLNTLGMLILKDMIRPQGDIWRLAVCLVDDDPTIRQSARTFFLQSTDKSNTLYNYLPDIFSHLCERYPRKALPAEPPAENDENTPPPNSENLIGNDPQPGADVIKEETKFTVILEHLFSLIDKSKHIEILVERFCLKFDNADEDAAIRVAYALSLLPYHERALQKLIDNFSRYKHFVLVDEMYHWISAIINGIKNAALKGLAKELDDLIQEMFKVDGRTPRNVPKKDAQSKKKAGKQGKRKRRKSKRVESADDDDDD